MDTYHGIRERVQYTCVDGYFVVYANHSIVLLIWDNTSKTARRAIMPALMSPMYTQQRIKKLTIISLLLQDLPPLHNKGVLGLNKSSL